METDLSKDDLTSIKERISTAKSDHIQDLERLYVMHAEDYLDDQRLRRESREDYGVGNNGQQQQQSGESGTGSSNGVGRLAELSEKRDVSSSLPPKNNSHS